MGRSRGNKKRDRNTSTLPQTPKQLKSDGLVEFSENLADHEDLEAMALSKDASAAKKRKR